MIAALDEVMLEDRCGLRGFACWQGHTGERWCGLAIWQRNGAKEHQDRSRTNARIQRLISDPATAASEAVAGKIDPKSYGLEVLLAKLSLWLDTQVEWHNLSAAIFQIHEVNWKVEAASSQEEAVGRIPDPLPTPHDQMRWAEYLQWLWRQTGELPLRQRTAYLLHTHTVFEWEAAGIASVHGVAGQLGLAPAHGARLWSQLPLDDLTIAEMLSCTRQQVINLRRVARDTLGHAWQRWIAEGADPPPEVARSSRVYPSCFRLLHRRTSRHDPSPSHRRRVARSRPAHLVARGNAGSQRAPRRLRRLPGGVGRPDPRVRRTREAARPGPAPGVDYETLASYLDGTMDPVDREILEADLRNHPDLTAQCADLRRLRAEEESAPASQLPNVILFPPVRQPLLWGAAVAALLMVMGLFWHYSVAPRTALTPGGGGREGSLDVLEAADVPADLRAATRTAALTGEIPLPEDWKALRGEEGTLLAEGTDPKPNESSFRLLAPVGVAVRGLQPVFRWTTRAGASAYRITILETQDGETRSSPVLPANAAPENTWTPAPPFVAGRRYTWQVQALDLAGNVLEKTPSPPRPEAHFQTLDAAREAELRRLEIAHPQAHLLLAVAAARLGLLAEAGQHLQELVAVDPGRGLSVELLRRVQTLQGNGQPSTTTAPTVTNGAQ